MLPGLFFLFIWIAYYASDLPPILSAQIPASSDTLDTAWF